MNKVEQIYAAEPGESKLSDGLDHYKLTMGNLALKLIETELIETEDIQVTFELKNRSPDRPLSQYVTPAALTKRLEEIRRQGFSAEEIAYFAGQQAQDGSVVFDEAYLDYLAELELPAVTVATDATSRELSVDTTGSWPAVSLWETVIMSEINQEYFARKIEVEGLDPDKLYAEGDRRLSAKIDVLKSRPDIKFSDFGTRRRFSRAWHKHVIKRLATELPDNFVGTSNPWFAYKYSLKPIGTYAHEMPMIYAALEDEAGGNPLDGHARMMNDWYEQYGEDLSIALTDTFTSQFFLADFSPEQAAKWRGVRHDSGDPYEFGDTLIDFYKNLDIDPTEKTIIYSDGLDIDTIIKLADYFKGRIKTTFGWGTTLTNDLGLPANNIVMKAVKVNDTAGVKLSDVATKHTGPASKVQEYQTRVEQRLAASA